MSLSICEHCFERTVSLEDAGVEFEIHTLLPDAVYQIFMEDKNGNIYWFNNVTSTAGILPVTGLGAFYNYNFLNTQRDTTVQPLQLNQHSNYIVTIGTSFDFNDTAPIPMEDGNSYECIVVKFRPIEPI